MTELMRRRRALMGAQSGGNIGVFDWTPADGLSALTITTSSGANPQYSLTETALKLYAPAKWASLRLLVNNFAYGDVYKITLEYNELVGNNINVLVTSRGDNGLNNVISLSTWNKKYVIIGSSTTSITKNPIPTSGSVELLVDKPNGTISATLNGVSYGPYTIADDQITSYTPIIVEGNSTSFYVAITHIKIENL